MFDPMASSGAGDNLTDTNGETKDVFEKQNVITHGVPKPTAPLTRSMWLHDVEGTLQEVRDLLPGTEPLQVGNGFMKYTHKMLFRSL